MLSSFSLHPAGRPLTFSLDVTDRYVTLDVEAEGTDGSTPRATIFVTWEQLADLVQLLDGRPEIFAVNVERMRRALSTPKAAPGDGPGAMLADPTQLAIDGAVARMRDNVRGHRA
jgi:hypothetical protein